MRCTPVVAKYIISNLTGSVCENKLVFYGAEEKQFFKVWPSSYFTAQPHYRYASVKLEWLV